MKPVLGVALLLAWSAAAGPRVCAQSQSGGDANSSNPQSQEKKSGNQQQPAAQSPADANPFPEDESTVPVVPSKNTPDLPQGSFGGSDSGHAALPAGDMDPVASPDDAGDSGDAQPASGFSSSDSGLGSLLNPPNEPQGKHGDRGEPIEPEHKETAKEDESVGKYYLDGKDWRAALSRYQSAMVLDPDNPDVYWGLAESNRHLGHYADARANYLKVMEYDPGSRHAKDAAKALKEPDLANAKSPATAQTAPKTQQ